MNVALSVKNILKFVRAMPLAFMLAVVVGSFMAGFHLHREYEDLKRSVETTRQKNDLIKQLQAP